MSRMQKRARDLYRELEKTLGNAPLSLTRTTKGHFVADIACDNGDIRKVYISGTPGDVRSDKNAMHQARHMARHAFVRGDSIDDGHNGGHAGSECPSQADQESQPGSQKKRLMKIGLNTGLVRSIHHDMRTIPTVLAMPLRSNAVVEDGEQCMRTHLDVWNFHQEMPQEPMRAIIETRLRKDGSIEESIAMAEWDPDAQDFRSPSDSLHTHHDSRQEQPVVKGVPLYRTGLGLEHIHMERMRHIDRELGQAFTLHPVAGPRNQPFFVKHVMGQGDEAEMYQDAPDLASLAPWMHHITQGLRANGVSPHAIHDLQLLMQSLPIWEMQQNETASQLLQRYQQMLGHYVETDNLALFIQERDDGSTGLVAKQWSTSNSFPLGAPDFWSVKQEDRAREHLMIDPAHTTIALTMDGHGNDEVEQDEQECEQKYRRESA